MNNYTMIAETSGGRVIKEININAECESEARWYLWDSMTAEEKDATASIECVEMVL